MADVTKEPARPGELPRVLGPLEALCVIVGCVIGSGIFLVPATVADSVRGMGEILLVWVVGGAFSLAGALTLAELGGMLPRAGGTYVYLREAYGPLPAFLFGWTEFWVIRAGSMATLAAAFARYVQQLVPPPFGMRSEFWQMAAAVLAIATVGAVNVRGTKFGSRVQVVGTALKVGALVAMMALPFLLNQADPRRLSPAWGASFGARELQGWMVALVAVLWAYDGWINLTPLAEEIRDPGVNVPRSLIGGMAILILLYVGMTVAYHLVLSMGEIASAHAQGEAVKRAIAADYCERLLGGAGKVAIALVVICSTFIALNGNALTGPRAYFAMARDGLFPAWLCRIHPRFQTPALAVVAQCGWAIVLTVAGTVLLAVSPPTRGLPHWLRAAWAVVHKTPLYNVLFTYVLFGATIFYALAVASVFVLRRRRPDLERPYRTWGYPVTPLVYLAAAAFLMANMLRATPFEACGGLIVIALGLPAYLFFAHRAGQEGGLRGSGRESGEAL